jgi:hypothetical protein
MSNRQEMEGFSTEELADALASQPLHDSAAAELTRRQFVAEEDLKVAQIAAAKAQIHSAKAMQQTSRWTAAAAIFTALSAIGTLASALGTWWVALHR